MLVRIKREFARSGAASAHLAEAVPLPGGPFPAGEGHLEALHEFARSNPMYTEREDAELAGVPCTAYSGDMGAYWLDSTKHGTSCQPFYPTWLASAYLAAAGAAGMGCTEAVDVGSGDGRIAYCAGLLGLAPHSIEIDGGLAALQASISGATGRPMGTACADALDAGYAGMGLLRPAFFVGGLPQMGGDILASAVIGRIRDVPGLAGRSRIVLAGSRSERPLAAGGAHFGWGPLIEGNGLQVLRTVDLPTAWTMDRDEETPYVYASFSRPQRTTGRP